MEERLVSRRGVRTYIPERVSNAVSLERNREQPKDPRIEDLVRLGQLTSAMRRDLRARGIDPRLARLILVFERRRPVRPREIAWKLGVARSTASRLLDRAEAIGLVDKFYFDMDRRGTEARLTEKGHEFRATVQRILAACAPDDPRFGLAYGRRAYAGRYED